MEKGVALPAKIATKECVLAIITNGFEEVDTINLISILRRAGLCVKSMGITSGLVSGAHGICLMPDLTFSDLDFIAKTNSPCVIILPEDKQCLSKLEADPRLHNFLRQILAQGNHIVVGIQGKRFLRKISVGDPRLFGSNSGAESLLLPWDQGQPVESLARNLVHRLGQSLPREVAEELS